MTAPGTGRRKQYLATLLGLMMVACTAAADAAEDWRYRITPYVWLPSIDGALKYGIPPGSAGSPEVDVDSGSFLEALNFAALVSGEARRGRFSIAGDFIYLSLSSDSSSVRGVSGFAGPRSRIPVSASLDAGTETDVDGFTVTLVGGYSLLADDRNIADLFAGVRYFHVDVNTSFRLGAAVNVAGAGAVLARSGSVGADEDLVDAIIGAKGRFGLGNGPWSLRYYADVGTGSSDITWQAMGGIAYSFDTFDVTAAYRHLAYEQDDDKLLQDFSFSGPLLGVSFRF
jgi:hypothetical protein